MSSRPHPGSERPLHGPLQSFDLGAEVGRLPRRGLGTEGSATPSRCARERA